MFLFNRGISYADPISVSTYLEIFTMTLCSIKISFLHHFDFVVCLKFLACSCDFSVYEANTFALKSALVPNRDLIHYNFLEEVSHYWIAKDYQKGPIPEFLRDREHLLKWVRVIIRTYKENIIDPGDLVQDHKEECEEEISEQKEHKEVIVVHGLPEGMAHTESDTRDDQLEDWDLEQYGVHIARPVCCSVFWINDSPFIVRIISESEKQRKLNCKLNTCGTEYRDNSWYAKKWTLWHQLWKSVRWMSSTHDET